MFKMILRKKKIIPCHVPHWKTISRASTRQGSYIPFYFNPFHILQNAKAAPTTLSGVPVTSIKIPAVDEPLFRAIVRRF